MMLAIALSATSCGGSKEPPHDADSFGEEPVSDEQNKNEVDPFFQGDSNRGTQKVELQEDEPPAEAAEDGRPEAAESE